FLVSLWKPVILLVPLVAWGWVISRVYDKHAARFHLNREMWNLVHMVVALVALLGALAIPLQGEVAFWIGLAVMLLVLGADLTAYAVVANRDERVPEEFHIQFSKMFNRVAEARAAKAAE